MSRDWILREQGSRDWRMLPIAIVMWAASLGAHALFAWRMSDGLGTGQAKADAGAGIDVTIIGMEWPVTRILPITVASCAAVAAMIVVSFRLRIRWTGTLTVCVAVACIGSMTAIASDTIAWHDPASAQARQSSSYHEVMATVTTPVIASDQRTYDCQTDIRLSGITVDGTDVRSTVAVRVYADESYCGQLRRGAVYLLTGVLQQARYGRIPLWLLLEGKQPIAQVRAPPWHLAAIAHVQEAFFTVTEQLSDQGRVLVPGLTMGVLGQDYIGGETGPMPVNSTYAQTLENQFRQSGIMHLMAVSGGHFVLVAGLVRRLCMWMLLDRRLTALLVSGVYVLLALAMFPSDSVTRAFIMGLIGALTYAMGRRTQALSALCWTVIGVLAVNPDMSASYGFALSSAAVLGIVLFAGRLAGAFERAMPHGIAEMMAMTVAAQLFTLPIQVLMEPELPLLSVPANLLVSPFVGLATMAGLMALACAWCEPWLAGVFAWISSWGTLVMERVALWLGGSTMAVIPWKDGVTGAVLIVAVEIGIGMLLVFVSRCLQHVRRYEAGMPGVRFGSAWHVRLSLWCEETRRLFTRRQAE